MLKRRTFARTGTLITLLDNPSPFELLPADFFHGRNELYPSSGDGMAYRLT
jgi:hypothetical protein